MEFADKELNSMIPLY